MDPGSRVVGIYTFRRIAIIQIGNDISGIRDNNVIIHQGRYFNASINGLKRFMVRPEQSVNSLLTQLFVFQCHPHLAREWTERTVIQFHHDMTSQL